MRSTRPLTIGLAVSGSLAACAGAGASPIEIVNPGFELTSRALEPGEQTNGAGGVGVLVATRFPFAGGVPSWDNPVEVPGWRTNVAPPPSLAVNRVGVLHPPLAGEPFIAGHSGQHVLANQAAQLGQVLGVHVQPSTRYRLDFLGGIGRFDPAYFFAVSLIAVDTPTTLPLEGQPGVRRLAITQGLVHPSDARGQMPPYALEFTTPPVLAPEIAGRFLGIHLFGSDGTPRVLYDDLRLDATPVPAPAAPLLGTVPTMAMLARRRRPR